MMGSRTEEKRIEKKERSAREDDSRTVAPPALLDNGRKPISAELSAELARVNREEMGGPA